MPRFFFHLTKGSRIVVRDTTGHDCANDQEALRFARRGDGLVVLRTPPPAPLKQYRIQVVDEAGYPIGTVLLSDIRLA